MAIRWAITAAVLLIILLALALCKVASDEDDYLESQIRVERLTPTPTPAPLPADMWMRYDVPLDVALQEYIYDLSAKYDVDPVLVYGIIYVETQGTWDADAVGDDGASFGLMQIYASEHTERCLRLGAVRLQDPFQNVKVGIDLLAELQGKGNGLDWTLMAYNGGENYAWDMVNAGKVSPYVGEVKSAAREIGQTAEAVCNY